MESKPVIGIVGGVCSGKSVAAAELASLGCALIDGDKLGHAALAEPDVRRQVEQRWGGGVLDAAGAVDRGRLGEIVFADAGELRELAAITWPRIRASIEAEIARAQADGAVPAVALDAAVLFEAGWDDLCSHVLFVSAPDDVRRRRAARRGWDERAWRGREKNQIPLDNKLARCYAALDSSSSVLQLREQTRQVYYRILRAYGS